MKATEIIAQLQNMVNEHGDFDLKVGIIEDDLSYEAYYQPDEFDINVTWDDYDNDLESGWLRIKLHAEECDCCDCMYNGMDANDYAVECALRNID